MRQGTHGERADETFVGHNKANVADVPAINLPDARSNMQRNDRRRHRLLRMTGSMGTPSRGPAASWTRMKGNWKPNQDPSNIPALPLHPLHFVWSNGHRNASCHIVRAFASMICHFFLLRKNSCSPTPSIFKDFQTLPLFLWFVTRSISRRQMKPVKILFMTPASSVITDTLVLAETKVPDQGMQFTTHKIPLNA